MSAKQSFSRYSFATGLRPAAPRLGCAAALAALLLCQLVTPAALNAQAFEPAAVLSNTVPNSDLRDDFIPKVANDGDGNWVAVWYSDDSLGGTIGNDFDILFSRSSDNGITWTPAAALNSNAASDSSTDDRGAEIATDGDGNWVAIWRRSSSIRVARSTDNGATWTTATTVNTSGSAYSAQLSTGAGTWMIVWYSYHFGGTGHDADIMMARSTDNGVTWSPAAAVNTNAATDSVSDFSPDIATDGAGTWVAVWQVTEVGESDYELMVARSTDDGVTWSAPVALTSNAQYDYDDQPQVAADGNGNWIVVWYSRDSLGGTIGTDYDILVARSSDNGASWSTPAALSNNSGSDYWPEVAVDDDGNWVAVWYSSNSAGGIGTDYDILTAYSDDAGASWTPAVALNSNAPTDTATDARPHIGTDADGIWLTVWYSYDSLGGIGHDGDILVARSDDNGANWTPAAALSNATEDSTYDFNPDVASDGARNWVAVWESVDSLGDTIGADRDILIARSSDNGVSWSAPAALNSNAASDEGNDYTPRVATDGAGNWIAVWQSRDTLGGTIGTDSDILFSRSNDNGATWTPPAALNSNAPSGWSSDYTPQVSTDGGGNWVVVWHSSDSLGGTIGTDSDILVARSIDNGASWSPAAALNSNAASDSRYSYDSRPKVSTDGAGNWVAVWDFYEREEVDDGSFTYHYRILVARSTDNGVNWTASTAITAPSSEFTGDSAPDVTTDGAGNWVVAWSSRNSLGDTIGADSDILVARSSDNGASWTPPAALHNDSGYSDYTPQVTTDGAGNWVAVWPSYSFTAAGAVIGSDADILMARSNDNGLTWTPAAALNSNAASDAGYDSAPRIAGGAGTWVTVWRSNDSLGGTASFDIDDIFVARGHICGDGIISGSNECDDGNSVDGDCCSSTCQLETTNPGCITAVSVTKNAGNDADVLPAGPATERRSEVSIVSSTGTSVQTRYAAITSSAGFQGIDLHSDYTLEVSVLVPSGAPYSIDIGTLLHGDINIVDDSTGTAAGNVGPITGTHTGGTLSGDLDLLGTSNGSNTGSPSADVSTAVSRNGAATITGVGTGTPIVHSLTFTWDQDCDSIPGGITGGDDCAVRLGLPSTLSSSTAGLYPGAPARTSSADGHIVTATLNLTCGNGVIDGVEECDDGNDLSGDCCSESCQLEPATLGCISDLSVTTNPGNDADEVFTSGFPPGTRERGSSVSILSSTGKSLQTRYAAYAASGGVLTADLHTDYSVEFSVLAPAGSPYTVEVDTSLSGDINVVDAASGSADGSRGVITGSQSGGTLTGDLGFLATSAANNTGIPSSDVNTPMSLSGTATITGVGTGSPVAHTLTFTWDSQCNSNGSGPSVGDLCAVRLGLPATLITAGEYPGSPTRTDSADGHFVTASLTALCGNGVVEGSEACDLGAANGAGDQCCTAACTLRPAMDVCRASGDLCDAAETCGASVDGTCPSDAPEAAGTACRAAADVCDAAEECDGTSMACPADAFLSSGTECRGSAGVCDVPEFCSGSSAACPTDNFASSSVTCRTSTGECDPAEFCTGSGALCPTDISSGWQQSFWLPGVDGPVRAIATIGTTVYIGGEFTFVNGIEVNGIARWDGSSWTALGSGVDGWVNALATDSSGNLYAGGQFTSAGGAPATNVARWNGSAWSSLGSGVSSAVNALATDTSDNLYAGGQFSSAGGSAATGVAKWDGANWSALGAGVDGVVLAVAVDGGGNVYAGGDITMAGGSSATVAAKWDGASWTDMGGGVPGITYSMATDSSGNLYASGFLEVSPGVFTELVVRWDDPTWAGIGTMDGSVFAITTDSSGNLYAGGTFSTAGGVGAEHVAMWNGTTWSALGAGTPGIVTALATDSSGTLYTGGTFATAGGADANNLAAWNGASWTDVGQGSGGLGLNGDVEALAIDSSGDVYGGGEFTAAGGVAVDGIAKWDGVGWAALGTDIGPGGVNALAIDASDNLYAGGGFHTGIGAVADRVAKWNGSAWTALGSGITGGSVNALATDGSGNLYAGGSFNTAGGVSADSIARWDGGSWSALGTGMNGTVFALATDSSGNVYAGGSFTTAGGTSASRIAMWNGSSWAALGSGTSFTVDALVVDASDNLYAGGAFLTAGGVSVSYVAKWDGASWTALGTGTSSAVSALALDGSGNLYAGGSFSHAGGVSANGLAVWNGTNWAAVGTGTDGTVRALATDGDDNLFLGGSFGEADGVASSRFAAYLPCASTTIDTPTSTPTLPPTQTPTPTPTAPPCGYFDDDSDGTGDLCDNCPLIFNPDQVNSDCSGGNAGCTDGGDACDPCPSDSTNNCSAAGSIGGSVDVDGGTLTSPDGSVEVEVPPGAVDEDTTITATDGGPPQDATAFRLGNVMVVQARPQNQTFVEPVTITFTWDDRDGHLATLNDPDNDSDGDRVDTGMCVGGDDDELSCDENTDCDSSTCTVNTSNIREENLVLRRNGTLFGKDGFQVSGATEFKCSLHQNGGGCELAVADCFQPPGTGQATVAGCCDMDNNTWSFQTCTFSEFSLGVGDFEESEGVDTYLVYKVKASKQSDNSHKFPRDWNIQLEDTTLPTTQVDNPENYIVKKENGLGNPSSINDDTGPVDAALHYIRYQAKEAREGAGPAADGKYPKAEKAPKRLWELNNALGTVVVESKKVRSLLVPASKDLDTPEPPDPGDHTHYLCYQVKPIKGVAAGQSPGRCDRQSPVNSKGACIDELDCGGTPGVTELCEKPRFAKNLQAFASDQFNDCATYKDSATVPFAGTAVEAKCLFDLRKPKELCNPVVKSNVGGSRITAAAVTDSIPGTTMSLLCYQAKLARKIGNDETGALAGLTEGAKLPERQTKHTRLLKKLGTEVYTTPGNDFPAPREIDTGKHDMLCLPSEVLAVGVVQ